jgi:hypothetical protein
MPYAKEEEISTFLYKSAYWAGLWFILLAIHWRDQIKENETDASCDMCVRQEKCMQDSDL